MALNVVVAGMPDGFQGGTSDGIWLSDAHRERLRTAAPDVWLEHIPVSVLHGGGSPERPPHAVLVETSGVLPGWERGRGILKRPGLERLMNPGLRLVQSCSAGAENLVSLIPDGVTFANASGVHAPAIAETVFAAVLADAKLLPQRRADQAERRWRQLPVRELSGSVMLVLGTGSIGEAIARLARAFDMRVIGVNRTGHSAPGFDKVTGHDTLVDSLGEADYLVVAVPLTTETRGMIGATELAAMKPGGFVANIARGPVIDEPALLSALEAGQVRHAFLDTFAIEPLPPEHPLWRAPGVDISPHDSHASQLTGERQIALFAENLRRLSSGEDLLNVVELSRGY